MKALFSASLRRGLTPISPCDLASPRFASASIWRRKSSTSTLNWPRIVLTTSDAVSASNRCSVSTSLRPNSPAFCAASCNSLLPCSLSRSAIVRPPPRRAPRRGTASAKAASTISSSPADPRAPPASGLSPKRLPNPLSPKNSSIRECRPKSDSSGEALGPDRRTISR